MGGKVDRLILGAGDKLAGQFTVVGELGRGAFGLVYLCRYDRVDRLCAVKVIHPARLEDPASVALMRAEAVRWAELGVHPNVVAAWNLVEHARLPCIVMEYLPGVRTLADLCAEHARSNQPLGWRAVLFLSAQIARGLDHAWSTSRLLHRDIKPGNILIAEGGTAKVTDFGLAISGRTEAIDSGSVLGTPCYMAPEVWSGQSSSPACDVYAFGVTAFEMLTGRWPFADLSGLTLEQVRHAHQTAPVPDPRAMMPDIPAALAELVCACMSKVPGRRPAGFSSILAVLEQVARKELGQSIDWVGPTVTINEPDRLLNLSSLHHQLGNGAKSRAYAEQALRLEPRSAPGWLALGNALNILEDRHGAIASFKKALSFDPDDHTERAALGNLALSSFLAGDEQAGCHWLQRAIELAQSRGRVGELDSLSNFFAKLLLPQQALELCEVVIAANPDAAMTWNNRAVLCRQNGLFAEAERSARSAIALNPLYAKSWANLANTLLFLDRFDEAGQAAARAIEIDPKTAGAYAALMNAYREMGDVAAARSVIEKGARVLPQHPLMQRALKMVRSRRFDGPDWNSPE